MFQNLPPVKGLSLDRLYNFVLVTHEQSIVKAAQGDLGKQSLISRQIKELESYFGLTLIQRKGRGIEITPEGRELANLIQLQFTQLKEFSAKAKKEIPIVNIHSNSSFLDWIIFPNAPLLEGMIKDYRLIFKTFSSTKIIEGLESYTTDLGALKDIEIPKSLHKTKFTSIEYSLFVPEKFKKQFNPKKPQSVSNLNICTYSAGFFFKGIQESCKRDGIELNIQLLCPNVHAIKDILKNNMMPVIMPNIAATGLDERKFTRYQLFSKPYQHELCLAWNPRMLETKPYLKQVIQNLKKLFS